MSTEVTAAMTSLCATCSDYERSGDLGQLRQVIAGARAARAVMGARRDELSVAVEIRRELDSLDDQLHKLTELLESMAVWPEITRASALASQSLDVRTSNNVMRLLVESCATTRHCEDLQVVLIATAAALYSLRRAAATREEMMASSTDFAPLRAVSRAHLSVLAELALGELRIHSDARFHLERWGATDEARHGYAFGDRRYAIRPEAAARRGLDARTMARAAMMMHRDRAYAELPSVVQIQAIVASCGGRCCLRAAA